MRMLQSWSSVLAAALIGSFCNLAGAQGLRVETGLRSPWSFDLSGFAEDGEHTAWLAGRWLPPHWWTTVRPRLGELPRAALSGLSPAPGSGRLTGLSTASGVAGTARYALPIGGLQVFGGGGAGHYRSNARLGPDPSALGGGLALHAVAGVSLPLADDAEVGVSLRRVWIQRDAGSVSGGVGEEGGNFLFLGVRLAH